VRLEAETEEREADTCARRLELARKISDEETARVAAGFEARHRRRRDLLKQKAELMERELRERESDLAEMRDSLREALRLGNPAPPVSGPGSD
jgi:hypothetical protein